MGNAIFIALLWFLMGAMDPHPHVRVTAMLFGMGYILCWAVPVWIKCDHVGTQNRILDRCRALLVLGSNAAERGDKAYASVILERIRRLESRWRFGASLPLRICLALWAITWGCVVSLTIKLVGAVYVQYGWSHTLMTGEQIAHEVVMLMVIDMFVVLYALLGYLENWKNPHAIENCGDRLWSILHGPRDVQLQPEEQPDYLNADGMTLFELFGLGLTFSQKDLDRARRRLVQELHPDLWHHASPTERLAREDALKRVNAAYDVLKSRMTA